MAFTTTPYCTLAQVKNALNLQATTWDTWIQSDLMPQAQATIDEYCGRTWQTDGTALTPASRLYDGNDRTVLMIDECVSFSQVLETSYLLVLGITGTYMVGNTTTVDITADCSLGPTKYVGQGLPGYRLARLSGLPFVGSGYHNYQVKGIFGNPNVPLDITRACIRLAVHYKKMQDTNYADGIVEQGGVRQKYSKQLPPDVVEILERHRRHNFVSRTR